MSAEATPPPPASEKASVYDRIRAEQAEKQRAATERATLASRALRALIDPEPHAELRERLRRTGGDLP